MELKNYGIIAGILIALILQGIAVAFMTIIININFVVQLVSYSITGVSLIALVVLIYFLIRKEPIKYALTDFQMPV